MSSPRAIIQIVIVGTQIFAKAFYEAGRQAMKNAQYRPAGGLASDAAGVTTATSGSVTDVLTRQHGMTLDEANLILNVKRGEEMENILKKYEHLFQTNSPPPPPQPGSAPAGRQPTHYYSHYLQSKVFRAKERIEAEVKAAQEQPSSPPSAERPPDSSEGGS